MKNRYICFACYHYHPEMTGVSEEKFNSGNNVCTEKNCTHKGEPLEPALECEVCKKLFKEDANHRHDV